MDNRLSTEQEFFRHFIKLIEEGIRKQTPMSKAPSDFESGKALAYHEIADMIVECSRIFNIPLNTLGIEDINPDILL
ncbi:MAG: hypothetical protein P0Y53_18945 [Candidatus Pseudobacter hemicellulosilyticus]|uniref:Uncharacterized protein n=1 Tax=Candidatus Pseudobacter hemicellulosilyticus TaxID=3121375 RepID=A0AAJ5WNV9_9BACT|nr:MAG: hypothetical protein P0Y53_18945 [Pseudobacter sp.]